MDGAVDAVGDQATDLALDEAIESTGLRTQRLIEIAVVTPGRGYGEAERRPPAIMSRRGSSWLHDLVARVEEQPSRLDELMVALTEVYNELNRMSLRGGVNEAGTTESEALLRFQEVRIASRRAAATLGTADHRGIVRHAADGTGSGINAAWQAEVLPFCTQVTEGRYPFDKLSAQEVANAGLPESCSVQMG